MLYIMLYMALMIQDIEVFVYFLLTTQRCSGESLLDNDDHGVSSNFDWCKEREYAKLHPPKT